MRQPRDRTFLPILVVLAGGCFFGLTWYMRSMERRAIENPAVRDQLIHGRARPLADVAQTIAHMQLVTAEVQTSVSTTVSHENWRGMALANVQAPVRLLYGVDVSQASTRHIGYSPATSEYLVRIPPPRRISTEVCGGDEVVEVQLGWARLRSRAGEYYLGLARKSLYDRARELVLSPDDARFVRETSVAQVRKAVEKLVGEGSMVTVVVDDSLDGVTTVNSAEAP